MTDAPDQMVMLNELMEAVGVYNDGVSSPEQLWARCLEVVRRLRAVAPTVQAR